MCLLFFSYRTTPGYRLVVAANRDEFLDRPTAPLSFFNREKSILAGRDLQGGGTWLGVTAGLKFAAITNFRDPSTNRADAPSRGELIANYLAGDMAAEVYLKRIVEVGAEYNGFNLVLGDGQGLFYYSNRGAGVQEIRPGFYGLSNNLLDVPWPKVARGKEMLRPHMVESTRIDTRLIFDLLSDSCRPPDDQLPDTGIGIAWERLLSSIFIDGANYGTRSSAVITVTDDGKITFIEKTIPSSSAGSVKAEYRRYCLNDQSCR